jgi:hypothetical protein
MEESKKNKDPVQEKMLNEKKAHSKSKIKLPASEDPNNPATKLISYCSATLSYYNFQVT